MDPLTIPLLLVAAAAGGGTGFLLARRRGEPGKSASERPSLEESLRKFPGFLRERVPPTLAT